MCVVQAHAKSVGLDVKNQPTGSRNATQGALSEDTKTLVQDFYKSDDISWQAPGLKVRVIIREVNSDGVRLKKTEQV